MKHPVPSLFDPSLIWPTLVAALWLNSPWGASLAAPVTAEQASAAVSRWVGLDGTPMGESLGTALQSIDTYRDKAGNPLYYVVYLKPSGLVIVAGDDLVEPIIAFAAAGRFDPSPTNPLGALVSKDLAARVAYARQSSPGSTSQSVLQAQAKWRLLGGAEGGPTSSALTSVSDVRVAPFVQSTWDQGTAGNVGTTACYNYYTPPYGDGNVNNYWAGCVATALSQLMRYYQFPTTAVGNAGFTIYSDSSPLTYYLHGGDGSGGAYVWSNMPLAPTSTPSTAQCQAIGALVADAGATVSMSYTASGSSSSLSDGKSALINTFHFSSARYGWNNNVYIGSGLVGMINPNLDARYPVLLSIDGPSGGHAVVADGYGYSTSTLYHHLNLGWSGVSTAWYALPLIDTSNGTFNVVDGCAYNTYTNGAGEIISGRVLDQIGRPVVGAAITATRTGGGTYTTVTDTNGIYALARIPANSYYSITATRTNYTSANGGFSTGTSSDWSATSGNYWGADLTMPMLTTALDHLAWGAVAPTQYLNTPFPATITAQNLTNGAATGFTGSVALSAYAPGVGSTTSTVIGSLVPNSYLYGSEMTHGYAFTPNTNLQVTAVRGYRTDKVSIWTDSGTLLGSQTISASGSWTEASVASPITLSAGTTYRIGAHIPAGWYGYFRTLSWPATFTYGTVGQNFYYSYGDVCPSSVYGTAQGPLVDLRCQVTFTNAIPVSPTASSAFVNGIWSGNVTLGQAATNVVLKADDGAGHTALSSPFTVVTPIRLLLPQRLAGGQFQCTVFSAAGLKLEILGATNLSNWTTVTNLTNTSGTIIFTDPATNIIRRYYRAHQLQ
jgi:hypothetical protein